MTSGVIEKFSSKEDNEEFDPKKIAHSELIIDTEQPKTQMCIRDRYMLRHLHQK